MMKEKTFKAVELTLLPSVAKTEERIREIYQDKFLPGGRLSVEAAIDIGGLLTDVKASMKHGHWLPWIKDRFPFDAKTAERWMKLFVKRGEFKIDTLSNLTSAYKFIGSGATTHVAHNSGEYEWYTPPVYIEAAREVMGGIVCDPASSKKANETVKAQVFYDLNQDGLKQKWGKTIWMNPPYKRGLVEWFVTALVEKVESGEVRQACVLVNNATDTAWFHALASVASAICFVEGRVTFITSAGETSGKPLQGQAILYVGNAKSVFSKTFKKFGFIVWTQHPKA